LRTIRVSGQEEVPMRSRERALATEHDVPDETVVYRHIETDTEVKLISRSDDVYRFRIAGERTMELPTEDWPTYRQFLEVDRYV
jgi:hypothetical protein